MHDMNNQQEVKVQTGGPSEGTPHQRDRCPRATEGAMEVIGAMPFRTKVKCRKALVQGKLARSSEAQNPTPMYGCIGNEMALKLVVSYSWRSAGLRESGIPKNERTNG